MLVSAKHQHESAIHITFFFTYLFNFDCAGSSLLYGLSLVAGRVCSLVVVLGLLISVASIVTEHRL